MRNFKTFRDDLVRLFPILLFTLAVLITYLLVPHQRNLDKEYTLSIFDTENSLLETATCSISGNYEYYYLQFSRNTVFSGVVHTNSIVIPEINGHLIATSGGKGPGTFQVMNTNETNITVGYYQREDDAYVFNFRNCDGMTYICTLVEME